MIDFGRAFDSAWERMMVILFRPFDIGKWFVIGFSAFLAGLLHGGNGANGSFNTNFNNPTWNKSGATHTPAFNWSQFDAALHNSLLGLQIGIIITVVIIGFIVGMIIVLAIYWLGTRGQFLFLDNIVRNRAAISWPWEYYSRQANSLFGFYLLLLLVAFLIFVPILVVAFLMALPLFEQDRWPVGGEIVGFVFLGLVYLLLGIVFNIILFLFRELGVPLMFRNGLMARVAFWETMNLCRLWPGSIAVFVLLRIALAFALLIVSIIICCFTCCIGALPYIGTVVLLPALVYIRCFTLDCLAQFGPQYDVWTVDVPPSDPGAAPSAMPTPAPVPVPQVNPQPPPG
ncbi:MAG: hypothetical protein LV479_04310 [Methylacidiphilales bacterium]|nr:hypothetical protein [Candidatus Methylacidiphilales bacterium]